MKLFVTGANGQLGREVLREAARRGCTGAGSGRGERRFELPEGMEYIPMELTDGAAVREAVCRLRPDAVIHCAAWTAVDAAELEENAGLARAVNAGAARSVAEACAACGCKLVFISTNYVFNGQGSEPWQPDCAAPDPLGVYGLTKLEGERAITETLKSYFIVRTSWLFGSGGGNFVRTMLRLGRERAELRVVNDETGAPTYARDLARLLVDMAQSDKFGIYHATNEGGPISRFDFAQEIFRQAGYETRLVPVTTAEYGQSGAKRPLNGALDTRKLAEAGFEPLPAWQDALSRYLRELREAEKWDR